MEKQAGQQRSIWNRFSEGDGTATDRANNRSITRMSLLWAGSLIAASALIGGVDMPTAAQWAVALAPNLLALLTLSRYLKMLRMTDEMLRRVHLEGLGVGFGTGYIFIIGYMLAEAAGAPPLNLAILIVIMTAGWLYGNVRALRYYR